MYLNVYAILYYIRFLTAAQFYFILEHVLFVNRLKKCAHVHETLERAQVIYHSTLPNDSTAERNTQP